MVRTSCELSGTLGSLWPTHYSLLLDKLVPARKLPETRNDRRRARPVVDLLHRYDAGLTWLPSSLQTAPFRPGPPHVRP